MKHINKLRLRLVLAEMAEDPSIPCLTSEIIEALTELELLAKAAEGTGLRLVKGSEDNVHGL